MLEIALVPFAKALCCQLLLLSDLVLVQWFGFVDHLLFESLVLCALVQCLFVAISKRGLNLVLFPEPSSLLLLEIAETRVKELVVVHCLLFGCAWYLRLRVCCPSASHERLAVVFVHAVTLLLAFTLGRLDPVQANVLL